MTDTNHNDVKEAIQDGISRTAIYRGIALCLPAITTDTPYVTHDDGSVTGRVFGISCPPSPQVQALIDAWLDGTALPTPPGASQPSVSPPPPANDPPIAHAVAASVQDSSTTWTATATVGEDCSAAVQYLPLCDASGNKHPGLRGVFGADGCNVGAFNGRDGNDYAGALTVTYDGATVASIPDAKFPRGCANKTIRYGRQAPWHPVDKTLFPNWATSTAPMPLIDLSKFDLSYNGLGVATYPGMGSAGAREEINFVPNYAVPCCVQPSDEAFAVVRAASDVMPWAIYMLDDDTGHPFDVTKYPNTTLLPWGQAKYEGNPIVAYAPGPKRVSGTPCAFDEAHETGYHFVASAATGSALDKWHAGVWANAELTALNPVWRQQYGIWRHYQERGVAWALRSVFLASFLSDQPDYYAARLEEQRKLAPMDSPLGFQATYMRAGANNVQGGPNTGIAVWQENYTRVVTAVMARKLPAWVEYATFLGQNLVAMLNMPQYPLWTLYVHTIKDSAGNFLPTMTDVLRATLRGPAGEGTTGAWPETDIDAALDPKVTPAALDALIRKNVPSYANNQLGDFIQYAAMPDGYPAWMRAACAGCVDLGIAGADAAWKVCESVPTKPAFSQEWGCNIVPEAAA